jgi:fructokinase
MKVIGAGFVTTDIILACDSLWSQVAAPVYSSGGTVTNVLTHLGYQGWDCYLVGGVGSDDFGSLIRKRLTKFDVNTDFLITRKDASTRRILHLVAVEGHKKGEHRFIERCPICEKEFKNFKPDDDLVFPTFDSSTILFIDRANPLTVKLAKNAKNAGSTVVFEPGNISRGRENVEEILNFTDILKYSRDLSFKGEGFFGEHRFLSSPPKNIKLIIETRSEEGVVVRSMVRRSRLRLAVTPLGKEYVVDKAGAGDAFMAGFLVGLGDKRIANIGAIDNGELEEAVQKGQALGALACLYVGSTSLLDKLSKKEINDAIDLIKQKRKIPDELKNKNAVQEWLKSHPQTDVDKQIDTKCHFCQLNS